MGDSVLTAALGLSTALFFGGADFLGGFAAQRISAIRATALSALGGLVVMSVIAPLLGGTLSVEALAWGALAGVLAGVSVSLIYASLAIGPMSLLAPLTAVISAIVPMTVGLLSGERLRPLGYVGLAVALIAVVLVGIVPDRTGQRPRLRGILLAVGAGSSVGMGLVIFDRMPPSSGLYPLLAGRVVTVALMFAVVGLIALRSRSTGIAEERGWKRGLWFAIAGGVLAATADGFMLTGIRVGDLSVMAVLVALYSAATVALAAIVLKERITRAQSAGLVLALAAAVLLALG